MSVLSFLPNPDDEDPDSGQKSLCSALKSIMPLLFPVSLLLQYGSVVFLDSRFHGNDEAFCGNDVFYRNQGVCGNFYGSNRVCGNNKDGVSEYDNGMRGVLSGLRGKVA